MIKKKIYVAHSRSFDFENELYKPLRNSILNELYDFIFPHETSEKQFDSKEFIKSQANAVIVEATFPKIGLGMEAGYADVCEVPIIAMYRLNSKFSSGLDYRSVEIITYDSPQDMIVQLESSLEKLFSD